MKPLPDSPIVLQSLLKYAEQWLDANNQAHRMSDRYFDWIAANAPKKSLAETLTVFDEAASIDGLSREADLHRPPCMDFVHYVDWPFSWDQSDDEAKNIANLVAASKAYRKRRLLRSARYEHVDRHLKMDTETIFLGFTREVRNKLDEIERSYQELTRRPPTLEVPAETTHLATAATPKSPGVGTRGPEQVVTLDQARTYARVSKDALEKKIKRVKRIPAEVQFPDPVKRTGHGVSFLYTWPEVRAFILAHYPNTTAHVPERYPEFTENT